MPLSDKLPRGRVKPQPEPGPLWKGPERDGVTFSLLNRFLACRERFRVRVIEGLRPAETFNHRIEYGNLWHACEEALAAHRADPDRNPADDSRWGERDEGVGNCWDVPLLSYAESLAHKYPLQQEQIDHWYNVCRVQFAEYVRYWSQHPDVTARTPLLQEAVFDVPYELPSGREVRLRGKFDSVDLIGEGKGAGVYLQENKTKGDVNHEAVRRQLTFDLQTMMYVVALGRIAPAGPRVPVKGVRYNVVRRPLSGGQGTITRHKPSKKNPAGESKAEFYSRLRGIIAEYPDTYFARWKVEVGPADVTAFRRQCLDPILEQLCDWYSWVRHAADNGHDVFDKPIHYRLPFGTSNPIWEGYESDLDNYLLTGSTVGLTRAETLFPELEETK